MIKLQNYPINDLMLTEDIISTYVSMFWNDVFTPLHSEDSPKHLYLMCKALYQEPKMGYRTLGHLVKVNCIDKDLFTNYLQERLGIFMDAYKTSAVQSIQFSNIVREGLISEDEARILFKTSYPESIQTHSFNNKKLPITMDPSNYGNVLVSNQVEDKTRYIVTDNVRTYQIDISSDGNVNTVTILGGSQFKWTDTKLDEGFKREIGKSTIYFVDGQIILQKQERPAKAFKQLTKDKKVSNKFLTFDIESIVVNNEHFPYLLNIFDGVNHLTSFINKELDRKELFNRFINNLLSLAKKGEKTIVYAHNFSGFDGILLLTHLIIHPQKYFINPIINEGRLITVDFRTKDGVRTIAGLGTWEAYIFSEELLNAQKYGY